MPDYTILYNTLHIIANEPIELSHEKVQSQLKFWKQLARDALGVFEDKQVISIQERIERLPLGRQQKISERLVELLDEPQGELHDDF